MKKLTTIVILVLLATVKLFAAPGNVDSLKKQLLVTIDSLKGPVYTQIAAEYLKFDTISNKGKRLTYENNAINYTLQALHYYSKYDDTTGLRISFDNLAKVYYKQKKYSQAKWFILQSNTLSRVKNDVPNIIASLIVLASIKTDIKDYKLALGDLNEALTLSTFNHFARTESAVQQSYALLYTRMKNYPKAAKALRRHNFIDDSIRRSEEAQLIAKLKATESGLNKKKIYTISYRGIYRRNLSKETVLL